MSDTFVQKAASAAGALAAVSVPVAADAVVLYRSNSPVSISLGSGPSSVGWDVDGTGGPDFILNRYSFSLVDPVEIPGYGGWDRLAVYRIHMAGAAPGAALVTNPANNGVEELNSSFRIGQTLQDYQWPGAANFNRAAFYRFESTQVVIPPSGGARTTSQTRTSYAEFPEENGFGPGENVIGFRFDRGLGTDFNYGWAKVEWDLSTPGQESFTITEWAWESEPGKAIHAVPAPAAAVSGLTLLAMGAAGVRQHRRRKAAAA